MKWCVYYCRYSLYFSGKLKKSRCSQLDFVAAENTQNMFHFRYAFYLISEKIFSGDLRISLVTIFAYSIFIILTFLSIVVTGERQQRGVPYEMFKYFLHSFHEKKNYPLNLSDHRFHWNVLLLIKRPQVVMQLVNYIWLNPSKNIAQKFVISIMPKYIDIEYVSTDLDTIFLNALFLIKSAL